MYAEKVQRVRCSTPPQRLLAGVARATLPVAAGMTVGPWGARSDQRATGIHRGLSATLLVARCVPPQDSAVVLVSADVVAWPGEIAAQMRTAIGAQCGVPEDAVVLTATHTHSSMPLEDPILDAWDDGSGRHARDKFLQALPELARRAAGNLRAGRLQAARRGCAVARSRRQTAFGRRLVGVTDPVIDAYLDAAEIIADDGETIATLVAYGCHPTTLGPANWQFSPDYVGSLREVLEQAAGAPCLFFQGCGADRAPSYGFSSSIADAEAVGQALGHVACGALLEERQAGYTIETLDVLESGAPLCLTRAMPPPADPARIRVVNRRVVLPLRARDPKAVDALVEGYRQALAAARRPEDAVALTRALIQQDICRRFPADDSDITVTGVRLGPVDVIAWPGELSGAYEAAFQRCDVNRHVVTITNANDYTDYLPWESQFAEGGYEVDASPFRAEACAAAIAVIAGVLDELAHEEPQSRE